MSLVKHLLTFDAGELSPLLDGRTDLAKYGAGCRLLENFIPRPQGGISKRPGTEYLGALRSGATNGRLVEFEITNESSVIIAMGDGYARFFRNGAPILVTGNPLEVAIPWTDGQLGQLQWKQLNDVMFFVHPDEAPRKLERASDTSWTFSEFVLGKYAPFLDTNLIEDHVITASWSGSIGVWSNAGVTYNIGALVNQTVGLVTKQWRCRYPHVSSALNAPNLNSKFTYRGRLYPIWMEIEVTPNGVAMEGQEITLTATLPTWDASHVDAYWQFTTKRQLWDYEVTRAPGPGTLYSKALEVRGRWTFQTFGNWRGNYTVQVTRDRGATWEDLRSFLSTQVTPRNVSTQGEEEAALMRIRFTGYSKNGTSGSPYAKLTTEDSEISGVVRIKTVTSSTVVVATVVTPVLAGTTDLWAEGAWSDVQGYPRCVELHQGRVVMAGTKRMPHTVWGSATDDFNNFKRGTDADESYVHTVVIGQREPICWLVSDRALVIGSGVGEFVMRGETEDKPITPEFGIAMRHSPNGSSTTGTGAIAGDSCTLYVQKGGRIVREMAYQYSSDRYESANLTLLADHLFSSAITDFCVMRNPFQVFWFLSGGVLYSLTYEKLQNIAAWARHPMAGTVLSVACIRKDREDEVWLVVDHGGGRPLTVERFRPLAISDPVDDGYWCDCATVVAAGSNPSGNPLFGLSVVGFSAGAAISAATLNSTFTAALSASAVVGRPYKARVMPMTPEIGLNNGSSRTREARIHSLVPSLWKSRGGLMGEDPNGAKFDPLRVGAAGALFTGEKAVSFDGRHDTRGMFCVVSDEPYPFTVRSLCLKMNFYGDAS